MTAQDRSRDGDDVRPRSRDGDDIRPRSRDGDDIQPSPTDQPYLARRHNWANLAQHAPAPRFLGHTTTWAELDRRVTALAGALSRRGISGGENIYCAEVENVLAGHPAIAEVAVIGRSHEKWGEVPVAVAAVTQPDLSLADLDEFLTERLARFKHPKHLEVVDALPRNPAGKVLKTELRSRFGGAKSGDAGERSSAAMVSVGETEG